MWQMLVGDCCEGAVRPFDRLAEAADGLLDSVTGVAKRYYIMTVACRNQ